MRITGHDPASPIDAWTVTTEQEHLTRQPVRDPLRSTTR